MIHAVFSWSLDWYGVAEQNESIRKTKKQDKQYKIKRIRN